MIPPETSPLPQAPYMDPVIAALVARYGTAAPAVAPPPTAPTPGLGGEGDYGGDPYAHAGWGTAQPFDYAAHPFVPNYGPAPAPRPPVNPGAMPQPGRPPGPTMFHRAPGSIGARLVAAHALRTRMNPYHGYGGNSYYG